MSAKRKTPDASICQAIVRVRAAHGGGTRQCRASAINGTRYCGNHGGEDGHHWKCDKLYGMGGCSCGLREWEQGGWFTIPSYRASHRSARAAGKKGRGK